MEVKEWILVCAFLSMAGGLFYVFRTELFKKPIRRSDSNEETFTLGIVSVGAMDFFLVQPAILFFKSAEYSFEWIVPSALDIGISLIMLLLILILNLLMFDTRFRRLFYKELPAN